MEIDWPPCVQCTFLRQTADPAPNATAGRSSTFSVVPLNTVPSSNRRTSFTFRFRLPAIIASIPGRSDGRRTPASSLSGLPSGTTSDGCGAVSAASAAEQKVLAIASWNPAGARCAADGAFLLGPRERRGLLRRTMAACWRSGCTRRRGRSLRSDRPHAQGRAANWEARLARRGLQLTLSGRIQVQSERLRLWSR